MSPTDLLHPSDLGLILSYYCTSECVHCVYNCGRGWKDWILPEQASAALQAGLDEWGRTFQVHLTGGEVFLNFPLLLETVRAADRLGIPVYVETNAVWCVDDGLAEKRFRELQEAGLKAVLVSCSPFHAASVPLLRTLTGIEAALNVFGPGRVTVYLPEWLERIAAISVEQAVPLKAFTDRYGKDLTRRLFWNDFELVAGGRAGYHLGALTHRQPAGFFERESCRWELFYDPHAHFDLYGNFIPSFCSGLAAGSWQHLAQLRQEYARQDYPPLIETLASEGPYGLFELASQDYGYQALPDGYAGKCHLCVDVRKHLFWRDDFSELQPAGFYERLSG